MTQEASYTLAEFFSMIWSIFTSTPVPGTNLTFAKLWIGIFCISLCTYFLHKTLNSEARYGSGKGDYRKKGGEKNE